MGATAGHTNLGKVFEITSASASGASPVFDNHNHRGVQIAINISAISGVTPIKVVIIEGYDTVSGNYFPILTSANFTVPTFSIMTIYPGIDSTVNQSASQILPASWRIRYTLAGTTPNATATFSACLLK